ncbi:3-hydroxyisobutyrate dehydrogenase [Amorphoplanes nipponensis]|uniref:3-hydroxyisobutyrate dehydrogenase n=1 Tax=Actinoplanes nipponensis TaxID=135950 RepID=A0A919JFK6_9ACTN|nr:NAD(P)-dependent oxidoreductase [Actinoplanes nipponensis]GIE49556.1 3-hydroxyisobutyrate dehydrogenase [Actinoplanes nipponensis]
MTSIAVLGTGRMGAAITRRLLATGHQVTVWNRTAAKTAPLVAAGARAAPTPAVPDAEVVITMLTDTEAVRAVLAAAAPRPGSVLVEMSTIGPAAVRGLTVPDGVTLVDAPVLGSVAAAESGRLTVLAGGDVTRALPVLEALGTVRRCGELGSGAALKLVANTALVTGLAALADTVAVARAVGVDVETALSVVGQGALGGAVTRATAAGAAFPVALAAKDLELVLSHVAAPMVRAAAEVLRGAPDQDADLGTIVPEAKP